MTYEEFKNNYKESKYFGMKCYVAGCDNPAEYEGGDARCYCGVCEKNFRIKEKWQEYLKKEKENKITLKPFPKIGKERDN